MKKNKKRKDIKSLIRKILKLLKILFITGIIIFSIFAIIHYFQTSPYFLAKNINIIGNSRLEASEIIHSCKIYPLKTNLLFLKTSSHESFCETHPWIEKAEVEKKLPDSVNIIINEEKPLFLFAFNGLYLVNNRGKIFKKIFALEFFDLPIVTVSQQVFELFKKNENYYFSEILKLLSTYEQWGGMEKFRIDEIEILPVLRFNLINYEKKITVTISKNDLKIFNYLYEIFNFLNEKKIEPEYILLENFEKTESFILKPVQNKNLL